MTVFEHLLSLQMKRLSFSDVWMPGKAGAPYIYHHIVFPERSWVGIDFYSNFHKQPLTSWKNPAAARTIICTDSTHTSGLSWILLKLIGCNWDVRRSKWSWGVQEYKWWPNSRVRQHTQSRFYSIFTSGTPLHDIFPQPPTRTKAPNPPLASQALNSIIALPFDNLCELTSLESLSAPDASSTLTVCALPVSAAKWSGVLTCSRRRYKNIRLSAVPNLGARSCGDWV